MPALVVYGMPDMRQDRLQELCTRLQNVAAGVAECKLHPTQVSVFFPVDRLRTRFGEELICFVFGLFKNPERTEEVRARLARDLKTALVTFSEKNIPECGFVEVFIQPFNKKDGFAFSWITHPQPPPPAASSLPSTP